MGAEACSGTPGLREAAKTGIAVGVALGVLLALLIASVLIYRRRQRMHAKHVHDKLNEPGATAKDSTRFNDCTSAINGACGARMSVGANL